MTELYASALHLDRKAVKALKITDPYSLHRVVYSLFPDIRTEAEKHSHIQSGIVYADQGGDFHGRKVLMVSDRPPMERVDGQYGDVISKPIAASFLDYPRYRFKVQVNPVRKDKQTGKRVAIKGRADTADWFIQRALNSWGFEVDPLHLQIDAIEVQQFNGQNNRRITLGKAHIQGQLTVTDPQQFQNSFKNGIGKGRAFGCGLLQIVPIIDNPFV
ncbi:MULTISPECIES: type I-E CRISPR-associated protein Cas6/Cse3/CasE [unclassified Oceanobacter]|uniref:type I-E CRISPR-associated protein Cas6/Cse3/CasE n=2 Tax=Gammaproteobacteria TaxID=1236 RepID=UPI002735B638|nr:MULTISPECIES: type I-E CRISPR-associated protein Cas6/Cse3/CasE [unclassified Oceanobacter]MDP2505855.1 type I-E CRISPR-associated protein Cas6/Cse3/CasE [Oceanobacter sp. 3_MG-2023]MDP2610546.1 type I-E CRISPR-associated protein Cas6/Cse3/CasE [Oceanobacter sp. 1_MG-2023]MDP2613803.1 type I-E CRISPR-associated protein Cas6/Cse3/CasE [Oceanobacter sp. 2_MG-2023]